MPDAEKDAPSYMQGVNAARLLSVCENPVTVTMGIGDPRPCGAAACHACGPCREFLARVIPPEGSNDA